MLSEAARRKIDPAAVQNFEALPGRGLSAVMDGTQYYAGNEALLREQGISSADAMRRVEELSGEGKTPLLFADQTKVIGLIGVADVVKPTSAEAVRAFQSMGIRTVMLTGDRRATAEAIQKQLGIPEVVAEVLPQDKEREIARLQESGRVVAMVGDGINDAPALARADVGLAIGAGTDVALESADIVLMRSDLLDAVTAVRLSRATLRNIKENLFWAFFYNSIGIPLAAGVFYSLLGWKLSPMIAAAAMSFSSIFVVGNALRLKRFRPLRHKDAGGDESHTTSQRKGEKPMKQYRLGIAGMSCGHCSAAVAKALNALDGVEAQVDLASASAAVNAQGEIGEEALRAAVEDAGYEVTQIETL